MRRGGGFKRFCRRSWGFQVFGFRILSFFSARGGLLKNEASMIKVNSA
jgi:hypothetical protein